MPTRYNIPTLKAAGKRRQTAKVSYRGFRGKLLRRVRFNNRRKLARTNVSRNRIGLNAKIYKALRNYGETKLIPTINISPSASGEASGAPVNRALGGSGQPGFYWAGCLSSRPSAWDSNIRQLNGISMQQGTEHNERIGDYVWLKKTHATFQLQMVPTQAPNHGLIQFRVIVVKARESVTPAGLVFSPQSSLFIQNTGTANGYLSVASGTPPNEIQPMNEFQIQNMPINKRNWVVFRDQKFILSAPDTIHADSPSGSNNLYFSSKYPCRKTFTVNFKHFKKTKYQEIEGAHKNYPLNYDPKYLIYVFAQPVGNDARPAGNWNIHMTGVTSFTDM